MSIKKIAIAATLAAITVFGSTAPSFAYSAYATAGLNVRSGPSTYYKKVGSIYKGQKVEVNHCKSGWCLIYWGGYKGWVIKKYLSTKYYGRGY